MLTLILHHSRLTAKVPLCACGTAAQGGALRLGASAVSLGGQVTLFTIRPPSELSLSAHNVKGDRVEAPARCVMCESRSR